MRVFINAVFAPIPVASAPPCSASCSAQCMQGAASVDGAAGQQGNGQVTGGAEGEAAASAASGPRLQDQLPKHSPFFIVNGAFTIFLTATFIFGIKGAVVSLYHTSGSPHVYSGDVGYMWGLWVSTGVFFGIVLLMTILEARVLWHVENITAYLFFITGLLLHSVTALTACLGEDTAMCLYLYPVSAIKAVEAGVHCGLLVMQWLTVLSFTVSLRWCRPHITSYFLLGGAWFIGLVVAAMWLVVQAGAAESCWDLDRYVRERFPARSSSTGILCCVCGGPALVIVGLLVDVVWDGTEGGTGMLTVETYKAKAGWIGWMHRGCYLTGVVLGVGGLSAALRTGMSLGYVTWTVVPMFGLAIAGAIRYWFQEPLRTAWQWAIRTMREGAKQVQKQTGASGRGKTLGKSAADMHAAYGGASLRYAQNQMGPVPVGRLGSAESHFFLHKRRT